MDSKAVGFCAIVAVLGIISAVLGFAAEATKLKLSDTAYYPDEGICVYQSSPAFTLGIISLVFAVITQIYINAAFGLCSCCRNNPNATPISKLCSVLSWVATVFSVTLLLAASILNGDESASTCQVEVKPGIFAAGAILALCSSAFGIVAYVTTTTTPTTQTTTNPAVAIPMGVKIDPQNNPQQYPFQQYTTPPQQSPLQQNPFQQQYTTPPQQSGLQQQYTPPPQQNTREKQYPQE